MNADFFCIDRITLALVNLCMLSNLTLSSALLLLDPAHLGRAEKGEFLLASQELRFMFHHFFFSFF